MRNSVALGCVLYEAWRLADPPLRADLQSAMRAAARREPSFAGALHKALQSYTPFLRPPDDRLHALADALYSAWQFADAPLRADLEQAIQAYVQRTPHALTALKRVSAVSPDSSVQTHVRRLNL
jgi:hypothetical protein